ncbi:MAG TPA: VacJ family lipoprotein [Casimicrobiaceae bacterium]|nr:VacJ family lipoprotein [Casimicrobiaceae bacterium]
MSSLRRLRSFAGSVAIAIALTGCATTSTRTASEVDPWEPMNRGLYQVHEALDKLILKPAVTVYTAVTPQPLRTGVSNFFNNIDDAFSGINGVLQGKPQKAGDDFGRVLTNTFFGLGGFIDVAGSAGIERGNEDFGQTLAVWGVPQGPYLFIPLLGPSTVRDASGTAVRIYLGPVGDIHDVGWRNAVYIVNVIDARYQAGDALDVVTTAALDKYTFIRNAYLQRRRYLIYDGKVPPEQEDKQ